MKTILLLLAAIVSGQTAAANLTPFSSECFRLSSLIQCNASGDQLFDECEGVNEDRYIAVAGDEIAEGIPVKLIGGSRFSSYEFADCGPASGGVAACELDLPPSGTYRLHIRQTGFFRRADPKTEECDRGTTVIF